MVWGKRAFEYADYAPYMDRLERLLMANPALYREFIMVSTQRPKPGISAYYAPRKAWTTGGGKPSSSVATATCLRCGFETTRSCPSLSAIETPSR